MSAAKSPDDRPMAVPQECKSNGVKSGYSISAHRLPRLKPLIPLRSTKPRSVRPSHATPDARASSSFRSAGPYFVVPATAVGRIYPFRFVSNLPQDTMSHAEHSRITP